MLGLEHHRRWGRQRVDLRREKGGGEKGTSLYITTYLGTCLHFNGQGIYELQFELIMLLHCQYNRPRPNKDSTLGAKVGQKGTSNVAQTASHG